MTVNFSKCLKNTACEKGSCEVGGEKSRVDKWLRNRYHNNLGDFTQCNPLHRAVVLKAKSQTGSSRVSRELGRNADSRVPPWPYWARNSGGGPHNLCFYKASTLKFVSTEIDHMKIEKPPHDSTADIYLHWPPRPPSVKNCCIGENHLPVKEKQNMYWERHFIKEARGFLNYFFLYGQKAHVVFKLNQKSKSPSFALKKKNPK